ncbi:Ig-like domain-containing protein [Alteromonas ponticola]|uniref:Lipoprotein n=1 Tax=Alteromonas ponticola TaxID=2720613 RepID=A0ABX1R3S7_9ALTE|nr:Ig-like domain-containing protein [Alteromonas ponticola]NMH61097.1 hypothetical protein [Alteromonas ponticola]
MRWVSYLSVAFVVGCGGSGDNDGPTNSPPPANAPELVISGPSEVVVGDSVGLVVTASDNSSLSSVNWRVDQENLKLLTAHTQVVGFDAPTAGDYLFTISARTASGRAINTDYSLTVIEGETPDAVVRVDHQAAEGGRISLRVDNNSTKTIESVSWQQTAGPAAVDVVYDDNDDPKQNIYFDAPRVTSDVIIAYRATIQYDDGSDASDEAQVLVKDMEIVDDAFFTRSEMYTSSHMQAYRKDSPYADALDECVYNNRITYPCEFETLPLIGQETESPTIDDILNRTYVSHPWMGNAFKKYLENAPAGDDMLSLLRAVTAVVISYDIRPSFYWVVTGAIYLDARNFWRTPAERDTLNTEPDYRSAFGNELAYRTTWRYVKDGEYYYPQPGLAPELRNTRTQLGVEQAIDWLLYHELGHANDFFNYASWSQIPLSTTPFDWFEDNAPKSDGLETSLPLMSPELHALAQVNFGGETATAEQKAYTAADVAAFYQDDVASSFYSYYTSREDYATLFEQFMMLYRIKASSDVGVFTAETFENEEYVLTWGQRNRINQSSVQPRAKYVVNRILPELNVDEIQASLPEPQLLPEGEDWYETLVLDGETIESTESLSLFRSQKVLAKDRPEIQPLLPVAVMEGKLN